MQSTKITITMVSAPNSTSMHTKPVSSVHALVSTHSVSTITLNNLFQLKCCSPSRISSPNNTTISSIKTKSFFPWVVHSTGASNTVLLNGNHGVRFIYKRLLLVLNLAVKAPTVSNTPCHNTPLKAISLKATLSHAACALLVNLRILTN